MLHAESRYLAGETFREGSRLLETARHSDTGVTGQDNKSISLLLLKLKTRIASECLALNALLEVFDKRLQEVW